MIEIQIKEPGGPEVLVPIEASIPEPGEEQVLIEVEASGVNRPDVMQRKGLYPPPREPAVFQGWKFQVRCES